MKVQMRNSSRGEGGQQGKSGFIFAVALLGLSFVSLFNIWPRASLVVNFPAIQELPNNSNSNTGGGGAVVEVQSMKVSSLASAFFENESKLQEAVQSNIVFHQQGGNLKAVQLLQDGAIDATLKKQGVKFVPEGSEHEGTGGSHELMAHLKRYYDQHYDPRGGYGKPLPGMLAPSSPVLMEDRWINVIEPSGGRQKWDAALGPIGPECNNLVQLGSKEGDGYKYICVVPNNNETSNETSSRNDCHIISVGGNDNWKFEVAAADQVGCVIHTFDCTLEGGRPKRKPNRDDIRFYNYCVDGTSHSDTHGRNYVSYRDMLKVADIEKPPAYFKMDVEGFEYDILAEMLNAPDLLPQQIQVELHWATRMTGVSWMPRARTSGEISLLANMMFHGGFLPVHSDFNPYCSSCMEVLYFRALE